MKTITADLAAHLAGEVLSLATCWKITCKDGTQLGFTDHDRDIDYGSLLYMASSGFTPSAISDTASLSVDNLDIEGMLSSLSLEENDIAAGKYDFAEVEIFKINYTNTAYGILKLRRGWLGEVTLKNNHFVAEVRGLTQALAQNMGEIYSPSCRASLGDSRCKINMAAHTSTGTASSVNDRQVFSDNARIELSGVFSQGLITFTSGVNAGLSMEIKEYIYVSGQGGTIRLALPMPYSIAIGDSYTIQKGCDKTLATCRSQFNNVINFRGEPHVPGLDRMLETASTRN